MNNKLKLHIWLQWGAVALVGLFAIGYVAVAYYGNAPKVVVEGNYIEAQPVEATQPVEEILGGLNPNIESRYLSINGDTTYYMTGSFINASTTIVAFASPFLMATTSANDVVINDTTNSGYGYTSATSTVDLVRLDIRTAATSTYSVSCGASAGISTADSVSLLDTAANGVATSTTGILENNLTAALGGLADAGTVVKITLNQQYPYFVCKITSTYTGAFTEASNTFDGKWAVRISRTR